MIKGLRKAIAAVNPPSMTREAKPK